MRTRNRKPTTAKPSLEDYDPRELLSFGAAWSPPKDARELAAQGRWRSWRQFLDDWAQVREEYLAHFSWMPRPPFADQAARIAAVEGLEALESAWHQAIIDYPLGWVDVDADDDVDPNGAA